MRALQRLRIPTLIFVNKIDRRGAERRAVLQSIADEADAGDRRRWVGAASSARAAAAFTRMSSDDSGVRRAPRRGARRPRRCVARRVRRRRVDRPVRAGCASALAVQTGQAGCTGVLRLRHDRRRRRRADRRHHRTAARPPRRRRRRRYRARCSRWSAGRPARRSPTCGCSPARCASATRCAVGQDAEAKVTAIRVFDAARRVRGRRSRRPDRQGLGPRRRPDRRRRSVYRDGTRQRPSLRAADAGNGGLPEDRPTRARCRPRWLSWRSRTR